MNFVKDIFRGILIGIANIIPGVSGGTMMVSMGIYDKIISSINGMFRNFKQSFKTLLPYMVGIVLGLVAFSFFIEYLNIAFPLPTASVFIGLIIGGCPIILKNFKGQKIKISYILTFLLFFLFIIGLQLVNAENVTTSTLHFSLLSLIQLFLVGMVASGTMVIPGVSGSMILMILGYYNPILNCITNCIKAMVSLNLSELMSNLFILLPFGIGVIVGIFAIAKLIEFLFKSFKLITFSAILGLVLASPIVILMQISLSTSTLGMILVSIVCFFIGASISFSLGKEA